MTTPRWLLLFVCVLATPFVATPASAEDPSADEIIDKALDQNSMGFQSGTARLEMTVENKGGDQRENKLDVKSKKIDGKARTRITLTAPKEVKGQTFLFAERDDEDDVWMYVPAFSVTRRIEGGQKRGAFLGSHFTYADLESRDLRDGEYKKLKDSKVGKHAVYVVQATPQKKSGSDYSRIVAYVRKSDFIPLKMKFYGKDKKLAKTLFVEKLDDTSDGETYVKQMTLRPESGGYTRLKILSLEGDVELPDAVFTKEQLGK